MDRNESINKADRLWNCANAMSLDFLQFHAYANQLVYNQGENIIEGAEKALVQIEDAIKRYRENRAQDYEESNVVAQEIAGAIDGLQKVQK